MIFTRDDVHHFKYFDYGEAFYGSKNGMRFRVAIDPLDNIFFKKGDERLGYKLKAYAWPEPDNFATAPNKDSCEFDYSEEGLDAVIAWLNEEYDKLIK